MNNCELIETLRAEIDRLRIEVEALRLVIQAQPVRYVPYTPYVPYPSPTYPPYQYPWWYTIYGDTLTQPQESGGTWCINSGVTG